MTEVFAESLPYVMCNRSIDVTYLMRSWKSSKESTNRTLTTGLLLYGRRLSSRISSTHRVRPSMYFLLGKPIHGVTIKSYY